jgi:hypothetical protein
MKAMYAVAGALAAAAMVTFLWGPGDPRDFEEGIARAALSHEAQAQDSRCPIKHDALGRADDWLIAACLAGGLGWYDAAQRYGVDAAKVFAVYGEEPVFAEVLDRYGHAVIPVVTHVVENGSMQYRAADGLSRLVRDRDLSFRELTPEQYGLIAVHEIHDRGYEMLSEFELVDGKAKRKPVTRTLLWGKNLMFGGLFDLESVIVRGERLPTWPEIGWAGLDMSIAAGGAGAAVGMLRAARTPARATGKAAGRLVRVQAASSGAIGALAIVGRSAGIAGILAVPYIALTRPDLIVAAAAWLADSAGLPSWVGVFGVYAVLCLAILAVARMLVRPAVRFLYVLYRVLARLVGTPGRRAASLSLRP